MINYEEARDRQVDNTEKKLDALIDALGFDCEEIKEMIIPSDQILIPHSYKLTKRDTNHVDTTISKLVVSWWEDEPWEVLPGDAMFIGRPDFVIKAYEALK